MEKLWIWLFQLSKKKIKKTHLNKNHNDIKCPRCKEWMSISGINHNHYQFDEAFGSSIICGQCNGLSYWNQVAFPFPALCNSQGTPLTAIPEDK